jgi:hypothetical protein
VRDPSPERLRGRYRIGHTIELRSEAAVRERPCDEREQLEMVVFHAVRWHHDHQQLRGRLAVQRIALNVELRSNE